jgi:glycosyltransferase involved in cell wall biosynthesis
MNILFLANHLNTGGITSYLLTLAAGLKQRGHQVFVASSGGELQGRFIQEGIDFVPIAIKTKCEVHPKILYSFFRLKKIIREKNIAVIHANTRVTQVLAHLLSQATGVPYLSTCHGFFKRRFFRLLCPYWGKRVIAISSQVKEHLLNDFKLSAEKIEVIHHGIEMSRFREQRTENREQRKKKLGLSEGAVVGIIARLSEVKGHAYLIRAMPEVCVSVPEAQLVIVGEGRLKNRLLALARELGLEKKVFFFPNSAGTRQLLALMDVFVLPSLHEGLGLALMEAMAAGVAVVGSDIGGIKTLIRQGYSGLLVEPGEVKGLARAIVELLQQPERRKFLADNGRAFIAENFSQQEMVIRTERMYQECLSQRS